MLRRLLRKVRSESPSESATPSTAWLDGYSGQSTKQLIALDGAYRRDSIVLAFEQGIEAKAIRVGMDDLSREERDVLAVEAVEREVNSDGFDGLFFHSSNEHAAYFVTALRAIGRHDVADLTQDAIDTLGLVEPPSPATIGALPNEDEARDQRLDDLDDRYYAIAGDLADALFEFIDANSDKIVLP